MRIVFYDEEGRAIKTWLRAEGICTLLPDVGDGVALRWGGSDDVFLYDVVKRTFGEDEISIDVKRTDYDGKDKG